MKKTSILFALTIVAMPMFAANTNYSVNDLVNAIENVNGTYLLPIFGAMFVIWAMITGFSSLSEMKKPAPASTDAIINWGKGLIWPAVVVIISGALQTVFTFLKP